MELHILLAGVEFGPYTEDKARQLLDEGFLSASDPAKRLDETDWLPLSDVLAASPVAAGASSVRPSVPRPAFKSLAAALEEHEPAEDYHAPLPPGSEVAEAPLAEAGENFPAPAAGLEPEPTEETEEPVPAPPPPLRKERLSVTGMQGPTVPGVIAASRVTRALAPRPSLQPLSSPPPTAPLPTVSPAARTTRKLARLAREEAESPMGAPGRPRSAPVASPEIKSSFAAALAKTRSVAADDTAPLPAPPRPTTKAPPAPTPEPKASPEPAPAAAAKPLAQAKVALRLAAQSRPAPAPAPRSPATAIASSSVRTAPISSLTGTAPLTSLTTTARARKPSVTGSLLIKEALIKAREKGAGEPAARVTPAPVRAPAPEVAPPPAPAPVPPAPEPPAAPAVPATPLRRAIKLTGRIPLPGSDVKPLPVERKAFPAPPKKEPVPPPTERRTEPIPLRESREAPSPTPKTTTARKTIKLTGPISLPGRAAPRPGPLGPAQPTGPLGGVSPRPVDGPKPAASASLVHPAEIAAAAALAAEALDEAETPVGTDVASSGSAVSSGTLKVTGSLRHPAPPRAPIRLSSPSGDSGLLPPALAESSATKPAAPVPEEELTIRPASGKIPVHEFPTEGVKVRTRRITTKVPLPDAPAESITPESSARPSPPPLPPRIEPIDEEDTPTQAIEPAPVEPETAPEASEIEARPAPATPPDKVRLRRPVKLELTSRKTPEPDKLSLEAFSKLSSQEEATPAEAPPLEETQPVSTRKTADFPWKRLKETTPLPWPATRRELLPSRGPFPLEWIFYAIIALGLIAGGTVGYLFFHHHHANSNEQVAQNATPDNSNAPGEIPASTTPPAAASPPATAVPAASAAVPPSTAEPPATTAPPAAATATPAPQPPPTSPAQDAARQASAFVSDGILKYQRGDFDGAVSAYNQALTINPKSTEAFFNRGIAKAAHDDLDGAVADYSQALEIDPNMGAAYFYRGLARHTKADLDGAISDYNDAVRIDGKNALAFFNRGLIRMQKDDIDGAIVDSTKALELDPHQIQSYYDRGLGRLAKGEADGALEDMKTFTQLAPQDGYTDYARLYIWLIETQKGQLAEANNELTAAMNSAWNGKSDDMVTRIGEFLLGQISESDLVRASASSIPVKDQGQRCEAWYFIGMRKLEAGDKDAAADALRKCVDTQKTDYCEFILAQEELKKLTPGGATDAAPLAAPRAAALPDPGTMTPPDGGATTTH